MKVVLFPGGDANVDLAELAEAFLDELRSEAKSPNTIRSYRADLRAFLSFFRGDACHLSTAVLRAFFHTYGKRSPATQARLRATLRSFVRWLVRNDVISSDPMEKLRSVKVPERLPRPLQPGDLKRILSCLVGKRDRLLFTLIVDTGLRVSEALNIRVENIRMEAQEITVMGKGKRERTIYLVKTEALRLLRQFLRETELRNGLLFRPDYRKQRSGVTGKPIHYTTVNESWRKACARAGIEATIHQLRHTYASRLISEGMDIQVVSKVLGHRRLATTQVYAEISDEAIKKALSEY